MLQRLVLRADGVHRWDGHRVGAEVIRTAIVLIVLCVCASRAQAIGTADPVATVRAYEWFATLQLNFAARAFDFQLSRYAQQIRYASVIARPLLRRSQPTELVTYRTQCVRPPAPDKSMLILK